MWFSNRQSSLRLAILALVLGLTSLVSCGGSDRDEDAWAANSAEGEEEAVELSSNYDIAPLAKAEADRDAEFRDQYQAPTRGIRRDFSILESAVGDFDEAAEAEGWRFEEGAAAEAAPSESADLGALYGQYAMSKEVEADDWPSEAEIAEEEAHFAMPDAVAPEPPATGSDARAESENEAPVVVGAAPQKHRRYAKRRLARRRMASSPAPEPVPVPGVESIPTPAPLPPVPSSEPDYAPLGADRSLASEGGAVLHDFEFGGFDEEEDEADSGDRYEMGDQEHALEGGGGPADRLMEVAAELGEEVDFGDPLEQPAEEPRLWWNAWAESTGLFKPLTNTFMSPLREKTPQAYLKPGKSYKVRVRLLDLALKGLAPGIVSAEVSGGPEGLSEIIKRADREDIEEIPLRVLVLPDSTFYSTRGSGAKSVRVHEVTLNVEKAVRLLEAGPPQNPLSGLDDATERSVLNLDFELQALGQKGMGSVALSFWLNGRPLDEFVFGFCIGDSPDEPNCKKASSYSNGLAGLDSRRTTYEASQPDAALHFIELPGADAKMIQGVFWRPGESPEFTTWELGGGVDGLRGWLATTFQSAVDNAVTYQNEKKMQYAGMDLFDLLFPDTVTTKHAREAFVRFIADSRQARSNGNQKPPSLFVRVIGLNSQQPLWLPIGLLAVPEVSTDGLPAVSLAASPSPPRAESIGFLVRSEMPLLRQGYNPDGSCLANWTIVAPPTGIEDADLTDAVGSMGDFRRWHAEHPFDHMEAFDDYLRTPTSSESVGVVITSHHGDSQLYFAPADSLSPGVGGRDRFGGPSFLILNGCETSTARSTEFIKRFNEKGITTVIATQSKIPGVVAGHFLDCFAEAVGDTLFSETVSDAYWESLVCLSKRKDDRGDPVGVRALTYTLIGDGSVTLCPPLEEEPSVGDEIENPALDPTNLF